MEIEVCVPDIGIDRVEVIEIFVKEGDVIKKEDGLISVEGNKSVLEIPSPVAGKIKKIYVKTGDIVSVNKLLALVDDASNNNFIKKDDSNNSYEGNTGIFSQLLNNNSIDSHSGSRSENNIYASPNIRRMARILNIDLSKITASGKNGRIVEEDLQKYRKVNTDINYKKKSEDPKYNINSKNIHEDKELFALSKVQQISGNHLLNNWKNIPHVTQFDEADITDLEEFRQSFNSDKLQNKQSQKISLLSFIVKSVIYALIKYPRFNSVLDKQKKNIFLKKDINIGIAVDTKIGLLVPVLKNLKYKNLSEISHEIMEIAKKAQNNRLTISEMCGGTFTISSLGGIGGTGFTPIINAPEASILGISKAAFKPVWKESKFIPRLILPFSLSYDHRIIDGADGVRFTTFLGQLLSDIRILLT